MLLVRIVSVILAVLLILGGLFILVRDVSKRENKLFFAICLLSAAWGITFQNIESFDSIQVVSTLNAAAYVLGILLMFAVTAFTYVFPKSRNTKTLKLYALLIIPTAILSATPLIAGDVIPNSEMPSGFEFTYGIFSVFYIIVMIVGLLLIASNLFFSRSKFNATERAQASLVGYGFLLSFIFGVGLSTLLPLIYPDTQLDNLAPFSLIFLVSFSGFAIAKHKLFDFRAAVARAVTYLFTTLVVVVGYVFAAFVLKRFLFPELKVTSTQLISNVILTVVLVVSYPALKRLLDRMSNRLFYRDLYDPQEVQEAINQITASTVDLKTLINETSGLLEGTFKAQEGGVSITYEAAGMNNKVFGRGLQERTLEEATKLLQGAEEIVYVPEITDLRTRRVFEKDNVEVILRLHTIETDMGFLFVGPKKSGLIYSKQDLLVLKTAVKTISVGAENALRFEEISKFNETLQGEVDDATKQLRRTNEKLKALDETKDEFISMASHQLRTPLTSVKGYVSMVLEGDAGELNEQQKKLLNQAFISSQRMVYLIADLLNVSRLRTGKFIIEAAPTSLPDVVEGEMSQLYETAEAKGLKLHFDKPADFPVLNLDETKTRQVIMNFADNAIYYTPSGGEITVALNATPSAVEFTVTDTGLGVPKKEQHHLFGKFYRAENAKKARPDGTGLGLFMAKKVVIAQGGAIIFKSQEGKGSTFGFTFPRHSLEVGQGTEKP